MVWCSGVTFRIRVSWGLLFDDCWLDNSAITCLNSSAGSVTGGVFRVCPGYSSASHIIFQQNFSETIVLWFCLLFCSLPFCIYPKYLDSGRWGSGWMWRGEGRGGEGVGVTFHIYGIVRMCVPNGPFFQRCQVYNLLPHLPFCFQKEV